MGFVSFCVVQNYVNLKIVIMLLLCSVPGFICQTDRI